MPRTQIDVRTDLHGSPGKLDKTSRALDGMRSHAKKSGIALRGLWKQVAIGMGVTLGVPALMRGVSRLAGSFLDVASKTEQYEVRLKALLGTKLKAARAMAFFEKTAAKVPFTLEQIIEAGTTVSAFGADLEKWTPILSDLAAVMGMEVVEAAAALGRAYAGGAGAADIFRERGILQIIKDSAKLKRGIKDITKLTLPEFRDAMYEAFTDPKGRIAGAADDLSKTWSGLVSMLQDKWFKFRKWVMEKGVFKFLKEELATFNKKLDEFIESGKLEEWAKNTAIAVLDAFKVIVEAVKNVVMTFQRIKLGLSAAAVEGSKLEKSLTMAGHGFLIMNKQVGLANELLVETSDHWGEVTNWEEKHRKKLEKTIDKTADLIEIFEKLKKSLSDTKEKIVNTALGTSNLSGKLKEAGDTIKGEVIPPSRDLYDVALMTIPLYERLQFWASEYGKKLLKMRKNMMELTEAQREQLSVMQQWASALQAGIPGVLAFIKAFILQKLMEKFLDKLLAMPLLKALAIITPMVIGINTLFSAIENMFETNLQKGGMIMKPTFAKLHPGEAVLPIKEAPRFFKETIRETMISTPQKIIAQVYIKIGEQTLYRETIKNVNRAGQLRDLKIPIQVVI